MVYIILATVLYATVILLGTAASRHTNTNLAAGISNLFSAIIPVILFAHLLTKKTITNEKFGITMAILSGLGVGLFVMAMNKSLSVNKVGVAAPIIFGGAIFLSTLFGTIIFKEKISPLQGVGLSFLAVGFLVIVYAQLTTK